MHEANRHWIEVFDAISDFILVHDENYRVLRVNRLRRTAALSIHT